MQPEIERTLLAAVAATQGHFAYESGHHGNLWLDLDALFMDARRARGWASALAERALACRPEFICGPLTGGAYLAQLLAVEIGAGFAFAERFVSESKLVRYRIPDCARVALHGKRVLLVDDAINAGSAVRVTMNDLQECRAELVGLAALLTLGGTAAQISKQHAVPLFTLASLERGIWPPGDCPLCKSGLPLADRIPRK